MICHAMPCHAMPCHAMPCHAMPCHAMPCMPCHAMPCHAMPCHAMPRCIGYNTMCPVCNNYYRGEKGLKIHLATSKCKDGNVEDLIPAYCVPSIGSNSEVLTCQENIHSTVSQNRELSDLSSLEKVTNKETHKMAENV